MARLNLFEFNDRPWCPRFVRESVVEALGRSLRWGRVYQAAVPLFDRFCRRTKTRVILELASGSGESTAILIDAMQESSLAVPRFILSDLFPNHQAFKALGRRYPETISTVHEPLDARAVPVELEYDAVAVISSFHHFPPDQAASILAACVKKRTPLFIMEPFQRNLISFAPLFFLGLPAYLINPFVAGRHRLVKLFFTYVLPILPFIGLWDGMVSMGRMYDRDELLALAERVPAEYCWEYHVVPYSLLGRVTVFIGCPSGDGD